MLKRTLYFVLPAAGLCVAVGAAKLPSRDQQQAPSRFQVPEGFAVEQVMTKKL